MSDVQTNLNTGGRNDTSTRGSSRRDLLGSVAAVGAAALLPLRTGSAQSSERATTRKGKIDVHYHIGQRRNPNGKARTNMGRFGNWTPELAIEDMDRGGVAVGMLSAAAGGGLPQPRKWNETAAQLAGDHPGFFGLLAALPMADVDESLKEIDYATSMLKADGFGIITSYGDAWLGDPKFRPVLRSSTAVKRSSSSTRPTLLVVPQAQ